VRKIVPGPCPSCNTEIEYVYQTENIPYFSDILIVSATCPACGFRYVDTQMLQQSEPVRYELPVTAAEDLEIRVVRSMSGALSIPELGIRIDPGPACQGFVTNVEGVLDRIENVVRGALRWGTEEEKENACRILDRITAVRAGNLPVTLVLQDPLGNSAIVSEKAKKTAYVEDKPT
jgi:zinc finger protein